MGLLDYDPTKLSRTPAASRPSGVIGSPSSAQDQNRGVGVPITQLLDELRQQEIAAAEQRWAEANTRPPVPTAQEQLNAHYQQMAAENPDLDRTIMKEGIKALHPDGEYLSALPTPDEVNRAGRQAMGYAEDPNATWGGVKALVTTLPSAITAAISSGADTIKGITGQDVSVANPDALDKVSTWAKNYQNEVILDLAREYGDKQALPGIKVTDVGLGVQNLGYSATMMGVGIAAGLLTFALGAPPAAEVVGATASGVAAYGAQYTAAMRQYMEKDNTEKIARTGKPLTPEEEETLRAKYDQFATESALHEAGWEAAGNLLAWKLISQPLKAIVPQSVQTTLTNTLATTMAGRAVTKTAASLPGRMAIKMGAMQASELGTETMTQMGQHNADVRAGFSDEAIRSWTNPADYWRSLKEVAPSVVVSTFLMGAGGSAGMAARKAWKNYVANNPADQDSVLRMANEQMVQGTRDFIANPTHIKTLPLEDVTQLIEATRALVAANPQYPDIAQAPAILNRELQRRAIIMGIDSGWMSADEAVASYPDFKADILQHKINLGSMGAAPIPGLAPAAAPVIPTAVEPAAAPAVGSTPEVAPPVGPVITKPAAPPAPAPKPTTSTVTPTLLDDIEIEINEADDNTLADLTWLDNNVTTSDEERILWVEGALERGVTPTVSESLSAVLEKTRPDLLEKVETTRQIDTPTIAPTTPVAELLPPTTTDAAPIPPSVPTTTPATAPTTTPASALPIREQKSKMLTETMTWMDTIDQNVLNQAFKTLDNGKWGGATWGKLKGVVDSGMDDNFTPEQFGQAMEAFKAEVSKGVARYLKATEAKAGEPSPTPAPIEDKGKKGDKGKPGKKGKPATAVTPAPAPKDETADKEYQADKTKYFRKLFDQSTKDAAGWVKISSTVRKYGPEMRERLMTAEKTGEIEVNWTDAPVADFLDEQPFLWEHRPDVRSGFWNYWWRIPKPDADSSTPPPDVISVPTANPGVEPDAKTAAILRALRTIDGVRVFRILDLRRALPDWSLEDFKKAVFAAHVAGWFNLGNEFSGPGNTSQDMLENPEDAYIQDEDITDNQYNSITLHDEAMQWLRDNAPGKEDSRSPAPSPAPSPPSTDEVLTPEASAEAWETLAKESKSFMTPDQTVAKPDDGMITKTMKAFQKLWWDVFQVRVEYYNVVEKATGKVVAAKTKGLALRGFPNIVWINVHDNSGGRTHLVALGHEVGHSLFRMYPDAAKQLVEFIKKYYITGGRKQMLAGMRAIYNASGQNLSNKTIDEEVIANLIGIVIADKQFWRDLAVENRSLIAKVWDVLESILDKIASGLARWGWVVQEFGELTSYFKDFDDLVNGIRGAMLEFGAWQRGEVAPGNEFTSLAELVAKKKKEAPKAKKTAGMKKTTPKAPQLPTKDQATDPKDLTDYEFGDLFDEVAGEYSASKEAEEQASAGDAAEKRPDVPTPTPASKQEMVEAARRWQGARLNAEDLLRAGGATNKDLLQLAKTSGKSFLDDYLIKRFGIDRSAAHDISNELTQKNIPADRTATVAEFAGEPWADKALSWGKKPSATAPAPTPTSAPAPTEKPQMTAKEKAEKAFKDIADGMKDIFTQANDDAIKFMLPGKFPGFNQSVYDKLVAVFEAGLEAAKEFFASVATVKERMSLFVKGVMDRVDKVFRNTAIGYLKYFTLTNKDKFSDAAVAAKKDVPKGEKPFLKEFLNKDGQAEWTGTNIGLLAMQLAAKREKWLYQGANNRTLQKYFSELVGVPLNAGEKYPGLFDQKALQESAELAVSMIAREELRALMDSKVEVNGDFVPALNPAERLIAGFRRLNELYESQPVFSERTSTSMANQAYSTPVHIGYLVQEFTGLTAASNRSAPWVLEPTIGTGMLVSTAENIVGFELDQRRLEALQTVWLSTNETDLPMGFNTLMDQAAILSRQDALNPFPSDLSVDVVKANPPFGEAPEDKHQSFDGYGPFTHRDHIIVARALKAMKDNGTATFILGGHNFKANTGKMSKAQWVFLNWLYHHYYVTHNIEMPGSTYSRQGTKFPYRIIHVVGRRLDPDANNVFAPTGADDRIIRARDVNQLLSIVQLHRGLATIEELGDNLPVALRSGAAKPVLAEKEVFQASYTPMSGGRVIDEVYVPAKMAAYVEAAQKDLVAQVGNVDDFVAKKMGWTKDKLFDVLAADQIDALAFVFRNMDRGVGTIIADQAGMGKGRDAGAVYLFAMSQGNKPIFVTTKPNLFSDLWRDIHDLGEDFNPFLMASDETSGSVYDQNGEVVHKLAPPAKRGAMLRAIAAAGAAAVGDQHNGIAATYSQFRDPGSAQTRALVPAAKGNMVILDEAHDASGEQSKQGEAIKAAIAQAKAVLYLSATFAKRATSMPVYNRTSLRYLEMPITDFERIMAWGGTAIQEIIANALVKRGELLRRERSFEGVEMTTSVDTANTVRDERIYNEFAARLIAMLQFNKLVAQAVTATKKDGVVMGVEVPPGAIIDGKIVEPSVKTTNFASTVHNMIRQLMLVMKVDATVAAAVEEVKAGRKVIIALANTMETWFADIGVQPGAPANATYAQVLEQALNRMLTVTIKPPTGGAATTHRINPKRLLPGLKSQYDALVESIRGIQASLPGSPIDAIRIGLARAGLTVDEVTGRTIVADITNPENPIWKARTGKERAERNKVINAFNNGPTGSGKGTDVLIVNSSGSTGLSAHAAPNFKDQRPRTYLGVQAEGDINTEVQKMGRIHRKGQTSTPKYVTVALNIPGEIRPLSVLMRKLRSLSANVSASVDSPLAPSMLAPDMFNKYGDQALMDWIRQNPSIVRMLGVAPGGLKEASLAEFSGKVALLPVSVQREFWSSLETAYDLIVSAAKEDGTFSLSVKDWDAKAVVVSKMRFASGTIEGDDLAGHTDIEVMDMQSQQQPLTWKHVDDLVEDKLAGMDPDDHVENILDQVEAQIGANVAYKIEGSRDAAAARGQQIDLEKEERALTAQYQRSYSDLQALLPQYKIGTRLTLTWGDDAAQVKAVVVGLSVNVKDPGDPSSLGRVKVTLATNLRWLRTMTRSLSALNDGRYKVEDKGEKTHWDGVDVTPAEWLPSEWTAGSGDARETRVVMTGNMLAAAREASKWRGSSMIRFTMKDGTLREGILLPFKDASGAALLMGKTMPLPNKYAAWGALKGGGQVMTSNENVVITTVKDSRTGGVMVNVETPANSKFKPLFTDAEFTSLTGELKKTKGKDPRMKSGSIPIDEAGMVRLLEIIGEKTGEGFKTERRQGDFGQQQQQQEPPEINAMVSLDSLGMFSPAEAAVDAMNFKSMPATAMLRAIDDGIKNGSFKEEELDDLGLREWLQDVEGKVTKQQVLRFIQDGGVRLVDDAGPGVKPVGVQELKQRIVDRIGPSLADNALYPWIDQKVYGSLASIHKHTRSMEIIKEKLGEFAHLSYQLVDDIHSAVQNDFLGFSVIGQTPEGVGSRKSTNARVKYLQQHPAILQVAEWVDSVLSPEEREHYNKRSAMYGSPASTKELLAILIAEDVDAIAVFDPIQKQLSVAQKHLVHSEYQKYSMPGEYEDYNVEFLRAPDLPWVEEYEPDHFEKVEKLVAHARRTTRTDVTGASVLFIEEIQSDIHQEGRDKGYAAAKQTAEPVPPADSQVPRGWDVVEPGGSLVPNAPLKKSWPLFMFKQMLRIAVQQGRDKIAWTPAEVQIDRYPGLNEKQQKGMIEFYDNRLKTAVERYVAKLDKKAKVETAGIKVTPEGDWYQKTQQVWAVTITDKMRQQVLERGQSRYSTAPMQRPVVRNTRNQLSMTGGLAPAKLLSLDEVKRIFKGMTVVQAINGDFEIRGVGGRNLVIQAVNYINPDVASLDVSYGRKKLDDREQVVGAYDLRQDRIRLLRGVGDKWVLVHEDIHFMEDIGLLNDLDIAIIKRAVKDAVARGEFTPTNPKDIGGVEDRARFLTAALKDRAGAEVSIMRRIMQKIRDFLAALAEFGRRSVNSIIRDIDTGRIYSVKQASRPAPRMTGQPAINLSVPLNLPPMAKNINALTDSVAVSAPQANAARFRFLTAPAGVAPTMTPGDVQRVEDELGAADFAEFVNLAKFFNKTGIVLPTNNPDDLSRAFRRLQTNQDLAHNYPAIDRLLKAEIAGGAKANQASIKDSNHMRAYYGLPHKDRQPITDLLIQGDAEGREWTMPELQKMGFTEDQMDGYLWVRRVLNSKLRQLVKRMVLPVLEPGQELTPEIMSAIMENKGAAATNQALSEAGFTDEQIKKLSWIAGWAAERKGYLPHKWSSPWVVRVDLPNTTGANGEVIRNQWMLPVDGLGIKIIPDRWKLNEILANAKAVTALKEQLSLSESQIKNLVDSGKIRLVHQRDIPVEVFERTSIDAMASILNSAVDKAWRGMVFGMTEEQANSMGDVKQAVVENMEELYLAKGFGRHLIGRKGVKGFRLDMESVLAEYLSGFNAFMAKSEKAIQFAKIMKDVDPRETPELWRHGKRFVSDMLGETNEAGWFKKIAGLFFIAADMSAAMLNLTQNFTHAIPLLKGVPYKYPGQQKKTAEWEVIGAMKDVVEEFFRAMKEPGRQMFAVARGGINYEENQAIRMAYDQGLLDPAFMGETTGITPNKVWQNWVGKTWSAIFAPFTMAEGLNRAATFLAAYRRSHSINDASAVVYQAHFPYGRGNRPELIRAMGGFGNVAFTFMSYPWQHLAFLKRLVEESLTAVYSGNRAEIKKQMKIVGSHLAYTFALGGIFGLPFAWLAPIIMGLFDDDPEDDLETMIRRQFESTLAGRVITRGIPAALLGNDMSWRVQGTDVVGLPIGLQLFGIAKARAEKSWGMIGQGEYSDAFFNVMPDLARNPWFAWRGYEEGGTRRGLPPIKYTPGEAVNRALGFTPVREAETFKAAEIGRTKRENRLKALEDFALRIMRADGDRNVIDQVREDVRKYNRKENEKGRAGVPLRWKTVLDSVKRRSKRYGTPLQELSPNYMRDYEKTVRDVYGLNENE